MTRSLFVLMLVGCMIGVGWYYERQAANSPAETDAPQPAEAVQESD